MGGLTVKLSHDVDDVRSIRPVGNNAVGHIRDRPKKKNNRRTSPPSAWLRRRRTRPADTSPGHWPTCCAKKSQLTWDLVVVAAGAEPSRCCHLVVVVGVVVACRKNKNKQAAIATNKQANEGCCFRLCLLRPTDRPDHYTRLRPHHVCPGCIDQWEPGSRA